MNDMLRSIAERATTAVLVLGAAAILLMPRSVTTITGVRETPELTSPDELPPLSKEDPTPFFQGRNIVEIRVAEEITLRQFLDRNRLNKPFHRKQIVEQLGSDKAGAPIAAGTVFRVVLTPVAADVPGARQSSSTGESE